MSDHNDPKKPADASEAARNANEAADQHRANGRTDPSKSAKASEDPAPETQAEADDIAGIGVGLGAGADVAAVLAAEVETLQAQIADLTNRLLRAHADLDNLRKRSEREKQETARYAITSFAKDTVGLVDNFERAKQAVAPEAIEKDQHLKALLEGVDMTEREFLNVLERHGVKRVSPKGEPFDPRLHQAVMERQDKSVANGTVVEVFQAGYTIEERCLRPAMVVVARGGGKADAKADPDTATGPEATSSTTADPAAAKSDEADSSDETSSTSAAPDSDNDNTKS